MCGGEGGRGGERGGGGGAGSGVGAEKVKETLKMSNVLYSGFACKCYI